MQDLSQALARIERLERSNRRMRRLGACLGAACLALGAAPLLSGFSTPAPDILRGESLELTDAAGNVYASITRSDSSGAMLLLQQEKAYTVMTTAGPALQLRAPDGRKNVFVGFDTRGETKVELADESLVGRASLKLKEDGSPGVYLFDKTGYDRTTMEFVDEAGQSIITLRGERGAVRAAHGLDADGNASSVYLDPRGRRRMGLIVPQDGTPLFTMDDEKTRPRMNMTMDFDGSPKLEFLRDDGLPSHKLP